MKQFLKKSRLEFVALSTTIRSCRIAYLHLETVLFIFIVLYLCFSSVSACLMQRLSFSLSEIKTYWMTLGLFSVSMCFWMSKKSQTHLSTVVQNTSKSSAYCECGGYACMADMRSLDVPGTGWVWAVWRGNSRVWEHTRQVCTAYVVTWCL